MTSQTETQRMATLLKSPDNAIEMASSISVDSWTLDGNRLIWDTYKTHVALYKKAPSINILLSYVEDKSKHNESDITLISAKKLLQDYDTQSPDDFEYFSKKIVEEARDNQIRQTGITLFKANDWLGLETMLADVRKSSNKQTLPDIIDMKILKTKPSSDPQNLLNEWAFERQAIIALVAPTGFGKSVLTMQLATHFACGKSTCGFIPKKAFKVLVIQNEDSDNDIAFMRDGSFDALTEAEIEMVHQNLFLSRLRASEGKAFLKALDGYCDKYNPDMVFVNPLLKYFGGDPCNAKETSNFLNELEPILEKHNCGMVFVHHTIKQGKQSRQNQIDSSYAGFGSAVWSNSVRDTIELRATNTEGFYKLIPGKRRSKWGWKKDMLIERSHNPLLPYWNEVDEDQYQAIMEADKLQEASRLTKEAILNAIPESPSKATIQEIERLCGKKPSTVRRHVKQLIIENQVAIYANDEAVAGRGNPSIKYFRISTLTPNNKDNEDYEA